MGYWGTCPLLNFHFSGHFRAAQTDIELYCGWLPRTNVNVQAYILVTVYCMNFTLFLCVTLKLFSLVPLPRALHQILATPLPSHYDPVYKIPYVRPTYHHCKADATVFLRATAYML